MSLPISLTVAALHDLASCAQSYESQSFGSNARVYERFASILLLLGSFPASGEFFYRDIRKRPFNPFPYLILYRVVFERVRVVAIIDARQHPTQIRRILQDR